MKNFSNLKTKQGQIFRTRIINKIDTNHYLLFLNKQIIIAEFSEILPVGNKIIVKVSNIARRISLQFLGVADDAFQNFIKSFPSKFNFSNEEWQVLFTKWIQYNLPLEENSIKIYQQLFKHLKKIMQICYHIFLRYGCWLKDGNLNQPSIIFH